MSDVCVALGACGDTATCARATRTRGAKEEKKAGKSLNLKEVGYRVACDLDAGHCRHALHRRVKTWVGVADGKGKWGAADDTGFG